MALYIPRSIFHLARLLYVRPETFGPTLVYTASPNQGETQNYSFDRTSCYRTLLIRKSSALTRKATGLDRSTAHCTHSSSRLLPILNSISLFHLYLSSRSVSEAPLHKSEEWLLASSCPSVRPSVGM